MQPSPNEVTSRCLVDNMLAQIVMEVAERQGPNVIRYDHNVMTPMRKIYGLLQVPPSNYERYRKARRRSPNSEGDLAIARRRIFISSWHLRMLTVKFKANNAEVSWHQIIIAAMLRHRKLLSLQEYTTSIIACYSFDIFISNRPVRTGLQDDEGPGCVQHWNIRTLNIISTAKLIQAYVWISSNITEFVVHAKDWHFDPTPCDLNGLIWRGECGTCDRAVGTELEEHSHKCRQSDREGRRRRGTGYESEEIDEMIEND